MTANVEAMIRAGVEAYRAGNKEEARALLEKAIELDDYNEEAWLWLSAVVETKEEQRTCLDNVIVINPNNERAKSGLAALGPAKPEPVEPDDPFASLDNETPFSEFNFDSEPTNDFAISDKAATAQPIWDDTIATSSSSSVYQGPQLTSDDYDDWMDNLNIAGGAVSQETTAPATNSNVFVDETQDEDSFDLDMFSDAGFTDTTEAPSSFNTFDFDEPNVPIRPTPPRATISPSASLQEPDDFDDFDDEPDEFLEEFDSIIDTDDSIFDDDDLTDLSADASFDKLTDPASADFLFDEENNQGMGEETDPRDLFSLIPPSVTPTRLPGTIEKVSFMPKAGVALLLLMNIGAIAAIVIQVVT